MDSKKTPLYDAHVNLQAKIVDFHGWMMPIQYSGVIDEHNAVRDSAGLFDVSHMGEFLVFGSKATESLDHIVTNDVKSLAEGQCLYTPMCYENGTVVDDLLIYKHNSEHYMLVVNASNIDKDYNWIQARVGDILEESKDKKCADKEDANPDELCLRDVSDKTAMMALQGPKAKDIIRGLTDCDVNEIRRFRFKDDVLVADVKALISRTGYTGEDGFEIYVNGNDAIEVWDSILKAGGDDVKPVGLGARDTLRLEAALMLYGNDIDDTTTPIEAAIEWTVKFNKDFIGKDILLEQKTTGVEKKMVGFELIEKGVPRQGYKIEDNSKEIGHVTSGTFSPTLKKSIGLCYVTPQYAKTGVTFDVVIRDKPHKAKVVDLPFYKGG